jgi:hypothetical protein
MQSPIAFTLPLALFNFLPVALTGTALWFLARYAGDQAPAERGLALAGGALILAGGLAKALWKLIAAATGQDLAWLGGALFPLMAPGFAMLAVALWGAVRAEAGRTLPRGLWRVALGAVLLALGAVLWREIVLGIPRGWFLPLLVLTSLGNLGASVLLIRAALRRRAFVTAGLFAVNLLMIFALQPIAMMQPKTLAVHWLEQSLTALGTACFAWAAWRLWRAACPVTGSGTRLG